MTYLNVLLVVVTPFCLAGCSYDSKRQMEESQSNKVGTAESQNDLAELNDKIAAKLPAGWGATFSTDKKQIVMASEEKKTVEYRSEAAFHLIESVDERIQIVLNAFAFLTSEKLAKQKKDNEDSQRMRIEFEQRHLSHLFDQVLLNYKISNHPFPPEMYEPQTAEDKKAVTEYSDLWEKTEPTELPTHYYKRFSFQIKHYPIINSGGPHIYIADAMASAQHNEILELVNSLLSKYE